MDQRAALTAPAHPPPTHTLPTPHTCHPLPLQVCEGLDLGLMQMKAGTRAVITINQPATYGFGAAGRPAGAAGGVAVPANSPVSFEVELVSFEKCKDKWEMDPAEKAAAAAARKDKGNAAYKVANLGRAVRQWTAAVDLAKR